MGIYICTVIKRKYAIWFYRKKGKFVLDPTHVREYPSVEAFVKLINREGFDVLEIANQPTVYPLLDLFLRFLIYVRLMKDYDNIATIYWKSKAMREIRQLLKIRVPGYYHVEILAKKKDLNEMSTRTNRKNKSKCNL